jgi:hypothetical protein
MEDFTLAELKNIARDEGLSGWSKFKKDVLFDFLVAKDVDIAKYKKPKNQAISFVNSGVNNLSLRLIKSIEGKIILSVPSIFVRVKINL